MEDDGYISIENDELYVVVSVATGNIVETRLKKYPVENTQGPWVIGFLVSQKRSLLIIISKVALQTHHLFILLKMLAMIMLC